MSDFLTDHGVIVGLVCALCAVAYGLVTTRQLLALSPGNERMQAISLAVQQGARAYLNRQYTVIAGVGVVLFVALIPIQNIRVAIGFLIGSVLSGAAGYIGMNVSVRANARVAEAQSRGEYGVAQLAFSVDRGGGVHNARIVRSSGSSILDRETLTLAERAQPLPPPPPEITGAQIPIVVPIRYNAR